MPVSDGCDLLLLLSAFFRAVKHGTQPVAELKRLVDGVGSLKPPMALHACVDANSVFSAISAEVVRMPAERHTHVREERPRNNRERELGSPAGGTGRAAIADYVEGVASVLANARSELAPGALVCIVVNDRRGLYPDLLRRAGLHLVDRYERHVNRRTGRRAGEYYESVLVCTA